MSKITQITILPKRKNKYKYFLNDNINNKHAGDYDTVYCFLNEHVKNKKLMLQIQDFMQTYVPFILDISNQKIYELGMSKESEKKQIIQKQFENVKKQKKTEKTLDKVWENVVNSIVKYGKS